MVMVEINSNAILVEPMKSRKDEEMIRAYNALLLQLKRAGICSQEARPRQRSIRQHEAPHPQHVQI
jgi:hypothetical protein